MASAGNDIVAWDAVDRLRTGTHRFYSKIISDGERERFREHFGGGFDESADGLAGISFDAFVWLAWSVKESAYKYLKRAQPAAGFSPLKYKIESLAASAPDYFFGTVLSGTCVLYFRSLTGREYVSTIISEREDFKGVRGEVRRIDGSGYSAQSAAVRELVVEGLQAVWPGRSWKIVKDDNGCPFAVAEGTPARIPVSLSHHGQYVAYSFVSALPFAAAAGAPVSGLI